MQMPKTLSTQRSPCRCMTERESHGVRLKLGGRKESELRELGELIIPGISSNWALLGEQGPGKQSDCICVIVEQRWLLVS
jgi:hypothetical protein